MLSGGESDKTSASLVKYDSLHQKANKCTPPAPHWFGLWTTILKPQVWRCCHLGFLLGGSTEDVLTGSDWEPEDGQVAS